MTRRRGFLQYLSLAALPGSIRTSRLRAVAFDMFTIFDPRGIVAVAESLAPGRGGMLCETWRARLFEYCWLHTAAGVYRDFQAVAEEALTYAARAQRVGLSSEARRVLVESYQRLPPWPDAPAVLQSLRNAGLRLAPLTNYAPQMMESLVAGARLRPLFERLISTDQARTFKPDPRAYALGVSAFGLRREEIAFAAAAGWDAAGAKWFGYPTFWVNRTGDPSEGLGSAPDATGSSLRELAAWIASR